MPVVKRTGWTTMRWASDLGDVHMTVTHSQESLLQIIERFNRKERYIVFQQVATTGEVGLDPSFREKLRRKGWPVPDQGVLVLTDYHLNWLYAALELHDGRWTSARTPCG